MAKIIKKFALPARFKESTYSVWVEFVELAAATKPLNLGQGFPNYLPPDYVRKALEEVATSDNPLVHQYTRGFGHPRLINVIGKLYSKLLNRSLNPASEVLITCGAYEALYSAITGHVDVGDQVIIIEPFYDCYEPIVRIAGGIPKFIPLKKVSEGDGCENWRLNEAELRALFNDDTKMIILNTPHNPLGKVFSKRELEFIAELCIKHDVLCLADEVYEWLVYAPAKHIRMATLPGMWERTMTVGSAGKTFSVTGWKCGWLYGPDYLVKNADIVHQNNVYTYNTPIQEALAICFEKELARLGSKECYFNSVSEELRPKRDYFMKVLREAGMKPTIPDGGYFVIADWSKLADKVNLSEETDKYTDFKFAKWMSKNVKLQGIPPSAFYCEQDKPLMANYVRYCFFKTDETLKEADTILKNWIRGDECKL